MNLPLVSWIAIIFGIVVVGLVAYFAIAKGRGFRFTAKKGSAEIGLEVSKEGDSPSDDSKGVGDIEDVSVLNEGKIKDAKVDIHIGHKIKKDD